MKLIKTYKLFFGSISFGILLWTFTFIFLPVETTENINPKIIFFIVSCYITLVLGFTLFKFKRSVKVPTDYTYLLRHLIIFLIFCFILRWIDLLVLREMSLSNEAITNRDLNTINGHRSNIVFAIASIFKTLYFFPFVITLKDKFQFNFYTICSYALLTLPIVEALIFGSRKPFFEIFLILIISIYFFKKPKINLKNLGVVFVSIIVLLIISVRVLYNREESRTGSQDIYTYLINARYNDILKPKERVSTFIQDDAVNPITKDYALILLQSGQYINHGVFEFNHIIDEPDLKVTKGQYVFYPFIKFLSKIAIVKDFKAVNPSPRNHVYLTAFGSFYLDFRWYTLLFFFLFGVFQRYIYDNSSSSFIHAPLLIYLSIINVFLPILNYLRGAGVYPIVGFIFLLAFQYYFSIKKNEKSIST